MPAPKDQFQIARGKVLDAFADVEAAIIALLKRHDGDVGCSSPVLSQKLDRLAALKPSTRLSKRRIGNIAKATADLRVLQDARNDIVHSKMRITDCGEFAVFLNVTHVHAPQPLARMMTAKTLQDLEAAIVALATRFRAEL